MRLIPRGKPLYEELPTIFLNWEEMAQKLKSDRFTGYIHVASENNIGIILFNEGNITGSQFLMPGSQQLRGQESLTKTSLSIQGKKGVLSIYETSTDISKMIEWYFDGTQIYSPMESYFIDFDKFMEVMPEKIITGFIKVTGETFSEFIFIEEGQVKGYFVDSMPELQRTSETLALVLNQKTTFIEVFKKTDLKSQTLLINSPEEPKTIQSHQSTQQHPEIQKVEHTSSESDTKVVQSVTLNRPRLDFSDEDIDPFKPHGEFSQNDTISISNHPVKIESKPPIEPATEPLREEQVLVKHPPTGKIAFLLDGIKKVAQNNIGEDILPWLDGQISRMQSVQTNISKQDLLLLVDEIERYVRTVRQNPAKATKLASQLRHIIESFGTNLV